ncbi:MAG: hypothetical protein GQ474_01600 [Sulfurimonas sp.]|nr:hypothetical protein [Sulfurimonas sp.]
MLEFDKEKYNNLRRKFGLTQSEIVDILESRGLETTLSTVKSWTRKGRDIAPEFTRMAVLAKILGVPTLSLYIGGEAELDTNINLYLKNNPEKRKEVCKFLCENPKYVDIIDKLELLSNDNVEAVLAIIDGLTVAKSTLSED